MVGQPGDHGLDDAVLGVGDRVRAGRTPSSAKTPTMISGGSTPTVKKSRGRTEQRQADAQQHEAEVEEEADPPDDGDVDDHDGEREGDAERDDWRPGS